MKHITIAASGGNANRMLQRMFGECLALSAPGVRVVNYDIPMFDMRMPCGHDKFEGPEMCLKKGHKQNVFSILEFLNSNEHCTVFQPCLGWRTEYYEEHLPALRRMFPIRGGTQFPDDHIVIAIRIEVKHPDYVPLPLRWYQEIVETTQLKPVFVGEVCSRAGQQYLSALKRAFPDAKFIKHQHARDDFDTFRINKNIVIAVGTFSWLAAYLSDRASMVHVPLCGCLNPLQRPDILAISRRPIFCYTQFPAVKWHGDNAALSDILVILENYRLINDISEIVP